MSFHLLSLEIHTPYFTTSRGDSPAPFGGVVCRQIGVEGPGPGCEPLKPHHLPPAVSSGILLRKCVGALARWNVRTFHAVRNT